MTAGDDASSLLAGLRVLDLSPDQLGAQASATLADFGADVVWVEPPTGARLRNEAAFPFLARGKRSIIADLASPDGLAQVTGLAESADVLIETYRPGVAERLGLGYRHLSTINPRLVYASITGFGRKGPWANLKGYEAVVAAVLGINSAFEGMASDKQPPFLTVPWCTFAASQGTLHGILAALIEREDSQRGQWVECNMAQAVTIHEGASSSWYSYLVTQRWPDAFSATGSVAGSTPMHHFVFRLLVGQTKDGNWLQFAQNRPRLFEVFLRELGLDWMLTDPKWEGIPLLDDPALRRELWLRMLEAVRDRTAAEWEAVFTADHDMMGERYRRGAEVLDHPQLVADHSVIEIDDTDRGLVRQPGALCVMSATPSSPTTSAPALPDRAGVEITWLADQDQLSAEPVDPTETAPLAGVTVLELAIQYAAPYSTTLLADLGARVIKVEPLDGDPIRRQIPQFPELGAGKVMQGKESIALDLGTAEGVEIIHRLAAKVDAVVEGFREGAAARHQVDAESLRRINPRLVYVNARGYGAGAPFGDRASFAPSFGAAGGIAAAHLGETGPKGDALDISQVADWSTVLRSASAGKYGSADGIGALCAATSALLALIRQRRVDDGQRVVSSMLLSTAHAMAGHVVAFPGSPSPMQPGPDMRGEHPLYRIYDTADGWVLLAAPQGAEWQRLTEVLAPYVDLGADPRFGTETDRAANAAALTGVLADVFTARGKDEWQTDFLAADIACVAVHAGRTEEVLMRDDLGRASGYLVDVTHPVFDDHPRLAPIVRFSRSTTRARPAGLCGAETDAILGELGYTTAEIAGLRTKGIVG